MAWRKAGSITVDSECCGGVFMFIWSAAILGSLQMILLEGLHTSVAT